MSKSRWIAGLASMAAVLMSTSAGATTIKEMSFGEVVDSADVCVMGEVISERRVVKNNQIYTRTKFRVTKSLYGYSYPIIVIDVPGGEKVLGDKNFSEIVSANPGFTRRPGIRVTEVVAGAPKFFMGQESLLFAKSVPNAKLRFDLEGFNQGAFNIVNGSVELPPNVGGLQSIQDASKMIMAERASLGSTSDEVAK